MRKPKYLSHSSLSLWAKDKEEFFLRTLADLRAPRLSQERYMSIGSAFDAYAKAALHETLFGKGSDPKFEFAAIFETQVESQNRDWAREHGRYVFDCYTLCGAYDDLLGMLQKAIEPPRFEFSVEGQVGGVPLLGKPDCRFVLPGPLHVILDWKVKGYCSKYAASPSKFYRLCRDGYDAVKLGVGKTKKCPEGKQSLSHNKRHSGYQPIEHRGLEIHAGYMEASSPEYADQLSIYGWLLGETPGDENVVVCIDEIVCTPTEERPLLRIANHRSRVSKGYQLALLQRAQECWDCITSGHIFREMSREQNDARIEALQQIAVGLQGDGSEHDAIYSEAVRPRIRR